jgi:hypothetical protein
VFAIAQVKPAAAQHACCMLQVQDSCSLCSHYDHPLRRTCAMFECCLLLAAADSAVRDEYPACRLPHYSSSWSLPLASSIHSLCAQAVSLCRA